MRIPLKLLAQLTRLLNTLGIELLSQELIHATKKACRTGIAGVYEVVTGVSGENATQLLADIMFLEIALAGREEFGGVRGRLVKKVCSFPCEWADVVWCGGC